MKAHPTRFITTCALLCAVTAPALAQMDTALKLTTSVPQAAADFRAGLSDFENLSQESAAARFEAASKADPNFGLARVLYAATSGALTREQQLVELNRGVSDAAKASTNELIYAAAYREGALNHRAAATALFRAAAELMPSDRLTQLAVVGGFATPPAQLTALREFIGKNPGYAPAYNNLAYVLWQTGDHAGALEAAKKQVELNPNAPNPHDSYAEMLEWNGNYAEAANEYRRAAATSTRFPEAYAGLAEVEALQGHYQQARTYLNQAAANAWTPQQKLGYMRQIVGTYAMEGAPLPTLQSQIEAVIADAKSRQESGVVATAYAQLAVTQARAGNVAAAHQSLAMAKSASAQTPWNVHYYGVAAHGMMKHWAPANAELNELKAAVAANPGASDYAAAAEGFLATEQGRPADALKILMTADTTNLVVMNRIAEAHAALGHKAEAAAWNEKVNADRQLNLADFPGMNARRRSRMASAKK